MKVKCIETGDEIDLTLGKIYDAKVVYDTIEGAKRIFDEFDSGEDYLYNAQRFEIVDASMM